MKSHLKVQCNSTKHDPNEDGNDREWYWIIQNSEKKNERGWTCLQQACAFYEWDPPPELTDLNDFRFQTSNFCNKHITRKINQKFSVAMAPKPEKWECHQSSISCSWTISLAVSWSSQLHFPLLQIATLRRRMRTSFGFGFGLTENFLFISLLMIGCFFY